MEYSNTTTKGGIIQREEMLCGLGDGGISGNAVLLRQITALNNHAYHEIWMAILSVNKHFKADDYNYTDYPDAPITIVAGQSDYTLPVAVTGGNVASFLRVNGIYLLKDGVRTYLTPMTGETLTTTAGTPSTYKINGKSIFFQCPFSASSATEYTSFHVEFQRVPDPFLYDDTTQQPGFLETYHDLIPLKTSSLYLLPTNPNLANQYEQRFLTRLELLKRDIAIIDDTFPPRLTPKVESNE